MYAASGNLHAASCLLQCACGSLNPLQSQVDADGGWLQVLT